MLRLFLRNRIREEWNGGCREPAAMEPLVLTWERGSKATGSAGFLRLSGGLACACRWPDSAGLIHRIFRS